MIISFILVASFTPILAFLSHNAVSRANSNAERTIKNSLKLIKESKETFSLSKDILNGLEEIRRYQEEDNTSMALKSSQKFNNNFWSFYEHSGNFLNLLENFEWNSNLEEKIHKLKKSREKIAMFLREVEGNIRTGTPIKKKSIIQYRTTVQDLVASSASINAVVVERHSSKLISLNSQLTSLSDLILKMGLIVVFLSLLMAIGISFILTEPIKKIYEEANKIKLEKLDEVDLERIKANTDEMERFKNVLGDVVLALKAEFRRERKEFNKLGSKIVRKLEKDVPRSTAESSLESACETKGINPKGISKEDLTDLVSELKISMGGLEVKEETFEEIKELREN